MLEQQIKQLLEQYKQNQLTEAQILEELKTLPFKDLGYAQVDLHRELRQNHPETIYCAGKTPEQIAGIFQCLAQKSCNILGTRASKEAFDMVQEILPEAQYYALPRLIVVNQQPLEKINSGTILVVSAGTSDLPVAQEAGMTAELLGNKVEYLNDVGVAGIHRLLAKVEILRQANVVIVVAGMEGALASVVGGLVECPVVAVPTSVGYGASFNGLAALLAMLNSCAAGVGVVNIDNGFGAGRLAATINALAQR
jgi:NCAIR mutase (PurE)-related protein